jgi:hypothetical protein
MIKRANHKYKDSYVLASQADNIKIDSQRYPDNTSEHNMHDPLFDQKLQFATEGLEYYHLEHLRTKISAVNALIIAKHILAMKMEANISDSRRRSSQSFLAKCHSLSYVNILNKSFFFQMVFAYIQVI